MTVTTTMLSPTEFVDSNGELVPLDIAPISVERAGELLPQVVELSRAVARYRGFLESVLTDEMIAKGQTEKRVGSTVFELKSDGVWTVTDEQELAAVLRVASATGDLTHEEVNAAMSERIVLSWHHGKLTTLAKRVPAIDQHRSRSEAPAKLRVKS